MMRAPRRERIFSAAYCLLAAMLLLSFCPAAPAWEREKAERSYRDALECCERIDAEAPRADYARCAHGFRRAYLYDPHYTHAPDALYQEGLLYQRMGEKFGTAEDLRTAAARFEFLARDYPSSRGARDARQRAAALRAGKEPSPPAAASPEAPTTAPVKISGAPPPPVLREEPGRALVLGVRFFSLDDATRVTIDLDRKTAYSRARLVNPERIYFDLAGTDLAEGLSDRSIPVGSDPLHRIRVGRFRSDTVRVVLDVGPGVEYGVREMENPFRIEIDLRRSAPGPAQAPELAVTTTPAPPPAVVTPPAPPPSAVTTTPAPPPAAAAAPAPPKETPQPTPKTSQGDRTLTRMLGLKIGRIVLDPGHGGNDLGTVGPNGLLEKDLTLAIARELKTLLEQGMGAQVFLTRDTDVYVSLEERTALANHYRADLFLSIHANSSRSHSTSGVETYYLDFATTDAEREIAARENATSMRSVSELENLVQKIARAEKSAESRELASIMQKRLHLGARRLLPATKDRGVRSAPFIVLIGAKMPSILAEVAFISNPKDEGVLSREEGRKAMAQALYDGIVGYVETLGSNLVHHRRDRK